jgi:hypothetical protein
MVGYRTFVTLGVMALFMLLKAMNALPEGLAQEQVVEAIMLVLTAVAAVFHALHEKPAA